MPLSSRSKAKPLSPQGLDLYRRSCFSNDFPILSREPLSAVLHDVCCPSKRSKLPAVTPCRRLEDNKLAYLPRMLSRDYSAWRGTIYKQDIAFCNTLQNAFQGCNRYWPIAWQTGATLRAVTLEPVIDSPLSIMPKSLDINSCLRRWF